MPPDDPAAATASDPAASAPASPALGDAPASAAVVEVSTTETPAAETPAAPTVEPAQEQAAADPGLLSASEPEKKPDDAPADAVPAHGVEPSLDRVPGAGEWPIPLKSDLQFPFVSGDLWDKGLSPIARRRLPLGYTGCMRLFYTVRVDVVGSGLPRGEVSARVLDRLLNEFGDEVEHPVDVGLSDQHVAGRGNKSF